MIKQYSRVRLNSNGHEAKGCPKGMLGYVIEVYDDGKYEVEFSAPSGTTIAQLVLDETEIILNPEN